MIRKDDDITLEGSNLIDGGGSGSGYRLDDGNGLSRNNKA